MVVLRLPIAVIGEATSGKSAFVQMAQSNGTSFPKNYIMTIGCDVVTKEIALDNEDVVEVCFYDIAGQKMYESMVGTFLEHAFAFFVIYDVTNKSTFETCKRWVNKARAIRHDMPGYLIANKMDLADKAEVTDKQANVFARANRLTFYKCSALRGSNVNEPVEDLARTFMEQYRNRVYEMMQSGLVQS